jgi:hypothetical protein
MKSKRLAIALGSFALLVTAAPARPDTVILLDGTSYTGQFGGAPGGQITFTDAQGIQYNFPLRDVQSLVFNPANDTVTAARCIAGSTRAATRSRSPIRRASDINSR